MTYEGKKLQIKITFIFTLTLFRHDPNHFTDQDLFTLALWDFLARVSVGILADFLLDWSTSDPIFYSFSGAL